jgi:hypothetical protein
MAKAKQTPVKQEQLITLTKEQYAVLFKVRSLLDSASDTLDAIDGDSNLFAIGKQVGDACGDVINAFNDLGDLIDETNPNDVENEDSNDDDNVWTFA